MSLSHPLLRPVGLACAVLALVGADPVLVSSARSDGDPLLLTLHLNRKAPRTMVAAWFVVD